MNCRLRLGAAVKNCWYCLAVSVSVTIVPETVFHGNITLYEGRRSCLQQGEVTLTTESTGLIHISMRGCLGKMYSGIAESLASSRFIASQPMASKRLARGSKPLCLKPLNPKP